jgi:integrase
VARETAAVLRIRDAVPVSLGDAVAAYFAERDLAPTSRRVYRLTLNRLVSHFGWGIPAAEITPRALAQFVASDYSHLAPASWNRTVATLGSFFAYTSRQGWTPAAPATALERRRARSDQAAHARRRAIAEDELRAFLDGDHPLREKTLWWLLYETAARANEVLALDIGDVDFANRRAVVLGKSGRAELVGWETKTARLLPRLLRGRKRGPVFLADIAPAPSRQPALADFDPDSRRARLSYRRAAQLFSHASGGWTLHQLRHSRLTHLAEAGIALPLLMAKSRHTSLTSLAVYAKPTFEAVAKATAALDPHQRR